MQDEGESTLLCQEHTIADCWGKCYMLSPVHRLSARSDFSCNCGLPPAAHNRWRSASTHDAIQCCCQGLPLPPARTAPFFCTVLVEDGALPVDIRNVVCGMAGIGKIAGVEYCFDFHCLTSLSDGEKQVVPIRHNLFFSIIRWNYPAFLQEK